MQLKSSCVVLRLSTVMVTDRLESHESSRHTCRGPTPLRLPRPHSGHSNRLAVGRALQARETELQRLGYRKTTSAVIVTVINSTDRYHDIMILARRWARRLAAGGPRNIR
jgi:hypothetical protein